MPPELFLESYPPAIRDIAESLRAAVRVAMPEAVEAVRPGWRIVGYDIPLATGRRTAYFAFVMPEQAHIHLGFEHGTLLSDPERVLLGAGITKKVRWLTFRPGDRVDPDQVAPFIREAAALARLSRGERLALALDRD
jgi:hypothetical protein